MWIDQKTKNSEMKTTSNGENLKKMKLEQLSNNGADFPQLLLMINFSLGYSKEALAEILSVALLSPACIHKNVG